MISGTREMSRLAGRLAGRERAGDDRAIDQALEFGSAVATDPTQPRWRRIAYANYVIGFAEGFTGDATRGDA